MNRPAALTSVQSLHLVKGEIHTSKYVGSDTANEEEQRYLQQERVKRGREERKEETTTTDMWGKFQSPFKFTAKWRPFIAIFTSIMLLSHPVRRYISSGCNIELHKYNSTSIMIRSGRVCINVTY